MIAKLKGMMDDRGDGTCIIDAGGVGYLVHASAKTLDGCPMTGEAVTLHIETQVREDAITLFGFTTTLERDMFRLLVSVQGVGAKVALAILSVLTPSDLQTAIAAQDKASVGRANGVGPKLATRIVTELKDKVAGLVFQPKGVTLDSNAGPVPAAAPEDKAQKDIEDAVAGLVGLGYKAMDAHGAVARAAQSLGDDASVQKLITAGLKELGTL